MQDHPQRRLIESNLRLVAFVANKYAGIVRHGAIDFDDLLQEGRLGLIKAAETFDASRGYKFSTWAFLHIRCAIFSAFSNSSRLVRIPAYAAQTTSRLSKEIVKSQTGSDDTAFVEAKLVEELGIHLDTARDLVAANHSTISIDEPLFKDSSDATVGDSIADRHAICPENASVSAELKAEIEYLFMELDPRERRVLTLRFGLADGREHALQEIANIMGIAKGNVRSIEACGLRKLRHPVRSGRLMDFVSTECREIFLKAQGFGSRQECETTQ